MSPRSNTEFFTDEGVEYVRIEYTYPDYSEWLESSDEKPRKRMTREEILAAINSGEFQKKREPNAVIVLNRTLDHLPVRELAKSDLSLDTFDVVWERSQAIEVDDALWIPLVCVRKNAEAGEAYLWRSELLMDQSDLVKAPSAELFEIDRADPDKRFVEYDGDDDEDSLAKAAWREVRHAIRDVINGVRSVF